MPLTECLTIAKPDDWHTHVRDAERLRRVAPYNLRRFASGRNNLIRDLPEVAHP